MMRLSYDLAVRCNGIIHAASAAAAAVGAGLAQIPCSDNAIITPIQLAMTISLGEVFEIDLSESSAKAALASVSAATVGRAVSQFLVGWVPGLGNAVNAFTAAGVTEALGWALTNDFARKSRSRMQKCA